MPFSHCCLCELSVFHCYEKIVLSKVQNRERHIHDSSLMDKEGIKCKIKQEGSLQVKRSFKERQEGETKLQVI